MPLPNARVFTRVADTIFPGMSRIVTEIDGYAIFFSDPALDCQAHHWDSGIADIVVWNEEFIPDAGPSGETAIETMQGTRLALDYVAATFNAIPPRGIMLAANAAFPTSRMDWWQDQQQAVLQAAVTAWTDGGTVVQLGWDGELFLNGALTVYTGRLGIQSGEEDLIVTRRLGVGLSNHGKESLPTVELVSLALASNGKVKPGYSVGGLYIDNSGIVDAIKSLAFSRIDVSAHNGGSQMSFVGGLRQED